ncbi:carboxymuconolactone decarboxylase family protein [Streptomyces sp. H34-S4]|uniref:carboxymuconolactone decarboxylase family protein n=1 Tax=Streptomyces sp. H34-S4 TaxID=2996463 RepID=UPI0022708430|nr:carboxymuconolactone decarboxylase family protein [Streptomyces sp. H34-S4]MCY0939216.1 carboxymuconolactone decarboxylase family protein [Streptomyces sp. H34-S4]
MGRIPQLTAETSDARQNALLEDTRRQLGRVPNLYAALANGPAALTGYLALRDALAQGVLATRLREELALLVAQENSCEYCIAAHTMRGRAMGLSDGDLARVRRADSDDPHTRAVLLIAKEVVRTGGRVTDEVLASARADEVTDAELAEIVAHVALNVLSNYFNHLAQPDLEFPAVEPVLDPAAGQPA